MISRIDKGPIAQIQVGYSARLSSYTCAIKRAAKRLLGPDVVDVLPIAKTGRWWSAKGNGGRHIGVVRIDGYTGTPDGASGALIRLGL